VKEIQILDNYLDDSKVEVIFYNGLTRIHIKELLFFKDMVLPDHLKLFYEQTNGLMIDSEYFLDDLDDPSHLLINSCENLILTKKKVNLLPDNRFILFATNEEEAFYLLDMKNLDPNGNPLILLTMPTYRVYIPLTNSFDVFLESSCLGILGIMESFGKEEPIPPTGISRKLMKKNKTVLALLKNMFETSKREFDLIELWHVPEKTKKVIQRSIANWLKEIQRLLTIFK